MTEQQVIDTVRRIIRQEITPDFMGRIVAALPSKYRATGLRFLSDPLIEDMRLIHPYGFASLPIPTMECLITSIGGDPTHLVCVGQNDTNRPSYLVPGDTCMYGPLGQVIYMNAAGMIKQGSPLASEPVVLGATLLQLLTLLITQIKAIISALGLPLFLSSAPGTPVSPNPAVTVALEALSATFDTLQSTYVDTPATNVVGYRNYVEKGI